MPVKEPEVPNLLLEAFNRKIEEDVRPTLTLLETIRDQLATYEAKVKEDAKQKALGAMLAAIGQPIKTAAPSTEVEKGLRSSIFSLLEQLGGAPPLVEAVSDKAEAETVRADVSPEEDQRQADPDLLSEELDAQLYLEEIDRFGQEAHQLVKARAECELQWLVASVRLTMCRLPVQNEYYGKLSNAIPILSAIRRQIGVTDFTKGLAQGQTFPWEQIIRDSAQAMAKFDAIAELGHEPKPKPKTQGTQGQAEPTSYAWPKLPSLRSKLQGKTFAIVGGIAVNEKTALIKKRFGFDVEWLEIDQGAARQTDAISRKIRSGTVGAVILLESFMPHKATSAVSDACNAAHVPWVYGGRCGVGAIEGALNSLEDKLAS
jgi:hypothetical protein